MGSSETSEGREQSGNRGLWEWLGDTMVGGLRAKHRVERGANQGGLVLAEGPEEQYRSPEVEMSLGFCGESRKSMWLEWMRSREEGERGRSGGILVVSRGWRT